jgi:hypothetical protein
MCIYEGIVIATMVMVTIIMISQYIDSKVPRVCDVLQLMNILPCYEVKVFRDGKRIKTSELMQHVNSPVKAYQMREAILYIEIY